jgi:hypothetical protein
MAHIPPLSFKVNATIGAYLGVTMVTGTANTVKVPAAVSECPIGITVDTVLDTTTAIPVAGPGNIAKLIFNDTVTSGALVGLDSAGKGVPHVNITAGSYVIGMLVGPTIAATGTIADVFINPFFKSIP